MRKGKSLSNINDNGKFTQAEPVINFYPHIKLYDATEEIQIKYSSSVGENAVFNLRIPEKNHKTFYT